MRYATLAILLGGLAMATGGCHRAGNDAGGITAQRSRVRDVSAGEFRLEYDAPRTPLNQWRYRGIVDGWHVLDYYGMGEGDEAVYRYSIRTHQRNLPKTFPEKAQPPVKTILSREDEEYFERLPAEKMRIRQQMGETATDW